MDQTFLILEATWQSTSICRLMASRENRQTHGIRGWIECTSAQLGVLQPRSATASTAGGHTAERCEHRSITITKLADLATPILMQTCSMGRTIPTARLEFLRADGQGERIKYYEVELENVLIGGVNQTVHEGGILIESVGLKFSRIKWRYTQQKIGGGVGGNTSGGLLHASSSARRCRLLCVWYAANWGWTVCTSCDDERDLARRAGVASHRRAQIWYW